MESGRMKVVVTGATGFIGRALVDALLARGDTVVALTRSPEKARQVLGPAVEALEWHPPDPGPWTEAVSGAGSVVNLAGEPVADRRWTGEQKQRVLESRVNATTAVVSAIEMAEPRPGVLVNGSAVGYYGSRGDEILTEQSGPGSDFLAHVVTEWESAARKVEAMGVRLVILRTGIVLGHGGALPQLTLPFRFFAGGTMGERGQWVPWIHIDDEVGLILYALTHPEVQGVLNASAPNPVTMEVLSREIGRTLGRPVWVPFVGTALKLALGERAEAVLASLRVLPAAAEAAGYPFQHTDVGEALPSILAT